MTYVRPVVVDNSSSNSDNPNGFYKKTLGVDTIYVDFDFNLAVHPVTKDFVLRRNEKAIIQSLEMLVKASYGDILMDAEAGGGVNSYLFEQNDALTAFSIASKVKETIANHEKRVELKDVSVFKTPDQQGLMVEVVFFYANNQDPVTERFMVSRIR